MTIEPEKLKRALPLIREQWRALGLHPGIHVPQPAEFTCATCNAEETCESAWDLYNTDGDCLESK